MESKIAFIWDLDGTLLDSYGIIVDSLHQVYSERGAKISKEEILKEVISVSVGHFIAKMEEEFSIPFEELKERYSYLSEKRKFDIKPIPHSKEILEYLKNKGILNYVFTHRGITTESVLKNIGLFDYFDEIVTSLNGFSFKPSPQGIDYLVNKYNLDRNNTYYVGDRSIDIGCANNAKVKSIMFIPSTSVASPTGKETYIIKDLLDIKQIV